MKKLLILQATGIILFAILVWLLYICNLFSVWSVIILYTLMGVANVYNANTMLMKPIEDLSIHDKLTGCYNRTKLDTKIPEYENYNIYGIIFFDLNNFKKINDKYGHDKGDELLIKASNQLRYWHEYGDLYRYGGDEFIVVIPNISSPLLEEITSKWFETLSNLNDDLDDDFKCNFSYGIGHKTNNLTFDQIINEADSNMYKMKKIIKGE